MFTMIPLGVLLGAQVAFASSASEPSEQFRKARKAKSAQPPGRWATCGSRGG